LMMKFGRAIQFAARINGSSPKELSAVTFAFIFSGF